MDVGTWGQIEGWGDVGMDAVIWGQTEGQGDMGMDVGTWGQTEGQREGPRSPVHHRHLDGAGHQQAVVRAGLRAGRRWPHIVPTASPHIVPTLPPRFVPIVVRFLQGEEQHGGDGAVLLDAPALQHRWDAGTRRRQGDGGRPWGGTGTVGTRGDARGVERD